MILQILQDGTTANIFGVPPAVGDVDGRLSATNLEALDATSGAFTYVGIFNVGSAVAGFQHLWIGRSTSTTATVAAGGNSGADDIYIRSYQFTDVNTGATLADVIENGSAGTTVNGAATSTTCSDTGVTTLGVDRLACNFGAITDDASGIAVFAGMTGGTWAHFQLYETATGTDGSLFFEDAAMAAAGTIDGGTDTITSLPWGVVGFALIGTTPPTPTSPNPPLQVELQAVSRASVW